MLAAAQVIHAISARLTGLPSTGARVFTSRAWPLAEKDLPAWRVVGPDEDIEPQTVHANALQEHRLQVELHGSVRATAALDDELNDMAAEALAPLFSTAPQVPPDALDGLKGKVQITLRRIERKLATEGEAAVGLVLITVRAEFRTRASAPETLA